MCAWVLVCVCVCFLVLEWLGGVVMWMWWMWWMGWMGKVGCGVYGICGWLVGEGLVVAGTVRAR